MTAAGEGDEPVLLRRRSKGVEVLELHRPHRLNAWNDDLEDAYFDALAAADDDPEVRAVVVTGAGRAFCAGADVAALAAVADGDLDTRRQRPRPRHFPLTLRKPLIAAVNGPAVGVGLAQALFADVRFAAPEARFIAAFPRIGSVAEYGTSWLLPRLVGAGRAADLLLSGRPVSGDEALRIGLAERLVASDELVQAAVAYAEDLASGCAPAAMADIKAQWVRDQDPDLQAALVRAEELRLTAFARPDLAEGIAAMRDRRPPAFAPLPPSR